MREEPFVLSVTLVFLGFSLVALLKAIVLSRRTKAAIRRYSTYPASQDPYICDVNMWRERLNMRRGESNGRMS